MQVDYTQNTSILVTATLVGRGRQAIYNTFTLAYEPTNKHLNGFVVTPTHIQKIQWEYRCFRAHAHIPEHQKNGHVCFFVGYGFIQELGPFLIHSETTLKLNTNFRNQGKRQDVP